MSVASIENTFEVCNVDARVGFANYPRPAIVSRRFANGMVEIFFLSTKNYSERGQSFSIAETHPCFKATGLTATSFTIHPPQTVPVKFVGPKRGELTDDLAKEFQDWLG